VAEAGKSWTFEVTLQRDGGRRARVSAGDRVRLEVGPPEGFGAADPSRWSPEHLYLAALQSCTMLAFLELAERNGVPVRDYRSTIEGTIARRDEDGRYAFVRVRHAPVVRVPPGQRDAARAIVAKAEHGCFVSASTKAEIVFDWEIREVAEVGAGG